MSYIVAPFGNIQSATSVGWSGFAPAVRGTRTNVTKGTVNLHLVPKPLVCVGVAAIALAAVTAACGSSSSSSSSAGTGSSSSGTTIPPVDASNLGADFATMKALTGLAAQGKGKIGVLLPDTTTSTRYVQYDAPY
ncbi:MAG: hypothetical protein ABJB93_10265, partial [Gaiellales bacterium]